MLEQEGPLIKNLGSAFICGSVVSQREKRGANFSISPFACPYPLLVHSIGPTHYKPEESKLK